MKSEWETFTLDDVCLKITDGAHNSPKSVDIGKPMASVKDLTTFGVDLTNARLIDEKEYEKLAKQGCQPHVNDVLIAKDGNSALDTVCVVKEPLDAVMLSSVAILRPDDNKLDSYYLKYYFSSKTIISYLKRNFISGAAIPRVVLRDFKKAEISLPPLNKQKVISQILRSLDDKIELNRKMNETLEAMAQALFKSWFVDFDPIHSRVKCKSDTELEVAAKELGISREVLELFPSEFVESEMGMIPLGWEVVKIEDVLKRYRAPKRYKKDAAHSYGRTMVLEQGADIILGYHDEIGEFKATADEPMFIFGDHTCVMRLSIKPFSISENVIPLSGSIRNGYWTYYATYGQQTFQEYRRHWSELIVRKITLAPVDICDYFAVIIRPFVLRIEHNRFENNELRMTRDTLLPKLLSGELDVSNIEQKEQN